MKEYTQRRGAPITLLEASQLGERQFEKRRRGVYSGERLIRDGIDGAMSSSPFRPSRMLLLFGQCQSLKKLGGTETGVMSGDLAWIRKVKEKCVLSCRQNCFM